MNRLEQSVQEFYAVGHAGGNDTGKGRVHPLSRLFVTFWYLLTVLSFHKYDWSGLAGMVLYVLIQCIWHEISFKGMLRRIWPALLLTALLGIANPLLDRELYVSTEYFVVTYGMVSMATLILKGVLCVMASYVLVVQIGIGQICYAMQCLHVPAEIVTVLLLINRYFAVLAGEAACMRQAYELRAPGQRGLHIRVWGSFVGLLLLRSIDRAQEIYESMKLRGFHGKMKAPGQKSSPAASIFYVAVWGAAFFLLRIFPVFQIAGRIL